MSFVALPANIVDNLAQDMREESIVPFSGGRVESAVKLVF